MRIDLSQQRDAIEFAEHALQLRFPSGTTWVTSRTDTGELAGVVVCLPVQHGNCTMHMAALRSFWFTEEFCRAVFTWAFASKGVTRLTASVQEGNTRSERLLLRVGFQKEAVMKGFTFGTLIVYRMLREECKWVES